MTPKTQAQPEPEAEPTPLDLFAARHEKRAASANRRAPRPAQRQYRLTVLPERVMLPQRTLTIEYPFSRLAIDETYQRLELKGWVGDLADLLRRGGVCPAIDVVHREWEKGDRLWIVDGQQRYWASWDVQKPLTCLVHNCRSLQEEIDLFIILNDRRRVGTNIIIHDHAGPSTDVLVAANDDPTHPWYNRIHFKGGAPGGRVAAGSLVTAMARFAGSTAGAMNSYLAAVDKYATKPEGKNQLVLFLRLLGTVYAPPARPNAEMLYAVARALAELKVKLPLPKPTITRLRHLKLDTVKASTRQERQLLMARRIAKAVAAQTPFSLDTP